MNDQPLLLPTLRSARSGKPWELEEVREVRSLIGALLRQASTSLTHYFDPLSGGFFHRIPKEEEKDPGDFSASSTATVVGFLDASHLLSEKPWAGTWKKLTKQILARPWDSAGLGDGNEYTTAFMLEALADLSVVRENTHNARLEDGVRKLNGILTRKGAIALKGFPPSAYLTQLAVRSLREQHDFDRESEDCAKEWAANHLNDELVTLRSSPKNADPFEIAYSVVLLAMLQHNPFPSERELLRYAVNEFFQMQQPDGTWPRGRPIFFYPEVGNAYCFEYEVLVQMLEEPSLVHLMLLNLDGLIQAARSLDETKHPLFPGYGWSSGHHRHLKYPESWSTASVFHFCHLLDRLLAEAARRALFAHLGEIYAPPETEGTGVLTAEFLDSRIESPQVDNSLRRAITERFIDPLFRNEDLIAQGRPLPDGVPTSAILFGPPGTSKTILGSYIAQALGWPYLRVDPSHLLRFGSERLHTAMYELFQMLTEAEGIVVLFDEFDELVRERDDRTAAESRFLTTAMLPRLQDLRDGRTVVFLFATNHLEVFDTAIRRPGRFDMIVPVMPPTAEAKLQEWGDVAKCMEKLGLGDQQKLHQQLEWLTFGEFKNIAKELAVANNEADFRRILGAMVKRSVLRSKPAGGDRSWSQIMATSQAQLRLPAV